LRGVDEYTVGWDGIQLLLNLARDGYHVARGQSRIWRETSMIF
jgi:hypothetical protein